MSAARGEHRDLRAAAEGRQSLREHGSTFHLAHLALGQVAAERVHLVYGFCRYVDDLADENEPPVARRELARVRDALRSGAADHPAIEGYLRFCSECSVDDRVTDEFLAGVEQDLVRSTYETEAQLLRYCFRVAGTVGLLMCSLFDVDDEEAGPFAIDLGIGMQLTNICRDVLEDADRGRVYLPAESPGGQLAAADLAARDPAAVAKARESVEALLDLADRYYRSADAGMRYLPARARLAVLVASRCYEAIGARIRSHPPEGLPDRAFVGGPRKAVHATRALTAWTDAAASRLVRRARLHCPDLHTALVGKPGADVRAG
ncbi:MAG: phytoene/squalene synthase family protein [Planctomycetota bacterium]